MRYGSVKATVSIPLGRYLMNYCNLYNLIVISCQFFLKDMMVSKSLYLFAEVDDTQQVD